jgi:hypothetical protein
MSEHPTFDMGEPEIGPIVRIERHPRDPDLAIVTRAHDHHAVVEFLDEAIAEARRQRPVPVDRTT